MWKIVSALKARIGLINKLLIRSLTQLLVQWFERLTDGQHWILNLAYITHSSYCLLRFIRLITWMWVELSELTLFCNIGYLALWRILMWRNTVEWNYSSTTRDSCQMCSTCGQERSQDYTSTHQKMYSHLRRVMIPIGLRRMLEGFSRAVVRCKPRSIPHFAEEYFKALLSFRNG